MDPPVSKGVQVIIIDLGPNEYKEGILRVEPDPRYSDFDPTDTG